MQILITHWLSHVLVLSGTIVREFSARVGVRRTGAMSTIEETPLQPRDSKATEDNRHTSCTERLEPLQVEDATGESASSAKVTVAPVTTNGWKKCFITVTILITYAFLNAGISVIAPFYPIVVSCISFLACMHGGILPVAGGTFDARQHALLSHESVRYWLDSVQWVEAWNTLIYTVILYKHSDHLLAANMVKSAMNNTRILTVGGEPAW